MQMQRERSSVIHGKFCSIRPITALQHLLHKLINSGQHIFYIRLSSSVYIIMHSLPEKEDTVQKPTCLEISLTGRAVFFPVSSPPVSTLPLFSPSLQLHLSRISLFSFFPSSPFLSVLCVFSLHSGLECVV